MKDNFSNVSSQYSKFRPGYPREMFEFLKTQIECFDTAWDCGTGNGQVALPLSKIFKTVYATDISTSQLRNAPARKNIIYSQQPAEKTIFRPEIFDLITVGQAIHWFEFDHFYSEVNRTLKPEGIIALMGYGLLTTEKKTLHLIHKLYYEDLGPFWDPERRFIEENYTTLPFPFCEIPVPTFEITMRWSVDHLTGYLKTWSAVQHFMKSKGFDPVDKILPELRRCFGNGGEVKFPVLFRVGKKL